MRWDFLSVLDRLGWLMPVGFYYKALHRPRLLWKIARNVIRRVGGLGKIDINVTSDNHWHHRNYHADVAVIGGGPAGMSAALAAAEHGAKVTLIDDQPRLGGSLRFSPRESVNIPGFEEATGDDLACKLADAALENDRVRVMTGATVFAYYQDNLLGIRRERDVVKLRAKRVVVATGSFDVPLLFENNDLPGVMLSSAAQRLIRLYGLRPGNRAVVATANDAGYQVALDLMDANVEVAAVVDSRPVLTEHADAVQALEAAGVEILNSSTIAKANGNNSLRGVEVRSLDARVRGGAATKVRCDLLCMSGDSQLADGLLYQAGATRDYNRDPGRSWTLGTAIQSSRGWGRDRVA